MTQVKVRLRTRRMNIRIKPLRPIHPFPARMAPSIVQRRLGTQRNLSVLDPMAGSGTTIVAARLSGHRAIGFDMDPLALIIAQAWCSDVDPKWTRRRTVKILEAAKGRCRGISRGDAYPDRSDAETRKFIRFWFDLTNRRQLAALSKEISKVKDSGERAFLWSAFSRLIVTKDAGASLARDVSHSRPHKVFTIAPVRPFERFIAAMETILRASHFGSGNKLPLAEVNEGDARNLPIRSGTIDLVITSPPYLNAIDYLRGHKLSLVWMGYSIKNIRFLRAHNIGAESSGHRA